MAEVAGLAVVLGVPVVGQLDHRRVSTAGFERCLGGGRILRRGEEHQRVLVLLVGPAADLLQPQQLAVKMQSRIEVAHAQHGVQKPHFRFSLEDACGTSGPSGLSR